MFQRPTTAQLQESTAAIPPSQQPISEPTPGPLFVIGCIVMPILWGVIVHRVFALIRRRRRTKPNQRQPSQREPVWPDFQI